MATIEDAAARTALALFIDDLQWSDRASLELIQYCALRLADELALRAVGLDYERFSGAGDYAQLAVHAPLGYCYQHRLCRLGRAGQAQSIGQQPRGVPAHGQVDPRSRSLSERGSAPPPRPAPTESAQPWHATAATNSSSTAATHCHR